MKSYIVLGLGRFGQSVARSLSELGHEVLAIDRREEVVQEFSDNLTHVVQAEVASEEVLRSVGVKNFDAAVVAIGDDIQSSILVTVLLKELGVKFVLAKAQNELHAKVLYKVGADKVIFPERDMGIRAAHNLVSSNILDMIELSPDISIMEISAHDYWVGKSLLELELRNRYKVNVMAIKRGEQIDVSPSGETVVRDNDIMIIIGRNDDIKNLQEDK